MQRPRKNGSPLTEVYGTDGGLLFREVRKDADVPAAVLTTTDVI